MDPPSAQLHQEVREAVTRQLEHRRPLLHHLNADSSWLLQIPRPVAATKKGGRAYYNILIDPWLAGGQSDVARWFSQQWHRFESACKSIAEVEELAREVEILASSGSRRPGSRRPPNGDTGDDDKQTLIDAVAISHEFTDHCHKETLLQIDRYVPVFASEYAARLIRNWKHFHHVETVPALERDHPDWRAASIPPLPEWLSIARLQEDADNLYYHSALVFSFTITPGPPPPPPSSSSSSAQTTSNRSTRSRRTAALPNGWIPDEGGDQADDDAAECVIYTPHGVRPQALDPIVAASPPLSVLALIHGLHDVAIDAGFWWERNRDKQPLSQLNLGGANGVRVQRVTRAKYWVGTHDEVKWGSGLVNWFLRRKVISTETFSSFGILSESRNGTMWFLGTSLSFL
ncbi:Major facilitator superfamily [Macrophomina phaseolina MS6]|uniref:Major facilitator superfamily n=1 Tax=Macrophomina phaseolina (strain MS6) TaxID=1126212 RepID=K2SNP3_MACPH|nr:Major facilitator superfamily [Macrophomina phaseolina MS6]